MRLLYSFVLLLSFNGLIAQQYVSYVFERLDGPVAPVLKLAYVALLELDEQTLVSWEDSTLRVRIGSSYSGVVVHSVLQQATGASFRAVDGPIVVADPSLNSAHPVNSRKLNVLPKEDLFSLLMRYAEGYGGPEYVDTGDEEGDGARFKAAYAVWVAEDPVGSETLLEKIRSLTQDR